MSKNSVEVKVFLPTSDIKRFCASSYEELCLKLRGIRGESVPSTAADSAASEEEEEEVVVVQYLDDEGDWVCLGSGDEWSEAVAHRGADGSLPLKVRVSSPRFRYGKCHRGRRVRRGGGFRRGGRRHMWNGGCGGVNAPKKKNRKNRLSKRIRRLQNKTRRVQFRLKKVTASGSNPQKAKILQNRLQRLQCRLVMLSVLRHRQNQKKGDEMMGPRVFQKRHGGRVRRGNGFFRRKFQKYGMFGPKCGGGRGGGGFCGRRGMKRNQKRQQNGGSGYGLATRLPIRIRRLRSRIQKLRFRMRQERKKKGQEGGGLAAVVDFRGGVNPNLRKRLKRLEAQLLMMRMLKKKRRFGGDNCWRNKQQQPPKKFRRIQKKPIRNGAKWRKQCCRRGQKTMTMCLRTPRMRPGRVNRRDLMMMGKGNRGFGEDERRIPFSGGGGNWSSMRRMHSFCGGGRNCFRMRKQRNWNQDF